MTAETNDRASRLEAENARLRARVKELEHTLYPPPPPPKPKAEPRRYLLAPPGSEVYKDTELGRALADLVDTWTTDALIYARKRHPDWEWHRAYRYGDIPKGGLYTTGRAASDARRAETDVPIYSVNKRNAALEAIKAQQQRLSDRERELIKALPKRRKNRRPSTLRGEHRVWVHRNQVLHDARDVLHRAWEMAVHERRDYDDIVRAAVTIADEALDREPHVTLDKIPGYRPDGMWDCDKCGYPFEDSGSAFTCEACVAADPQARKFDRDTIEEGGPLAEHFAERRRTSRANLRWVTNPSWEAEE